MNNFNGSFFSYPGITPEEMHLLQQATADLSENQLRNFEIYYAGKRKNPGDILLFTLLGFGFVAGVQRFVLGQTGMGLLYFFTGGLCAVGTIIDLINHKKLTNEYNRDMVYEAYQVAKMSA